MSDTYSVIGEALYDFMEDLDISGAFPVVEDESEEEENEQPGWGTMLNRPPKADEINVYPAFAVTPARDGQETGDTDTDLDAITYSVFLIVSYREATSAEEQLRKLVDIVRTEFRELRHDPNPLHASAYNLAFTGEWGGTPDQGERWYRLDVTVWVNEILVAETP